MKILAAKIFFVVCLFLAPSYVCSTGIPVVDAANLSQNMLTAIEEIAQTLKQIQEYKTQLEQYERQLQDALAPDEYIWDEADTTINEMIGLVKSVEDLKDLVLGYDDYFEMLASGLTEDELKNVIEIDKGLFKTENSAIDALIDTITNQQSNLSKDAERLVELQEKGEAAGEKGHMEAMQVANMMSSHMSNQLLQIRGVLISQSNVEASYRMKQNDKDARTIAILNELTRGKFQKSEKSAF